MKAIAHAIAALCFAILSAPVMLLGLLNAALIAGIVGAAVCLIIAYALFHKAEALMVHEQIGRRHYKGDLRNIA